MSTRNIVFWAVFAGSVSLLLLVGDNYWLRIGSTIALYAVLASSWNIIGGFTGYPSFATAAFFGLGAYTSAIAQLHGLPIPLAWGLSAVAGGLFALLLGLGLLRLRGHYFAVASLVVAEVFRELITSGGEFTGGGMGLNLSLLQMSPLAQARMFLLVFSVMAALAAVLSFWILKARFGVALRCIEQNEEAAAMVGVAVTRYKTFALALSATFASAAGAVYANWLNYIDPSDVFNVLLSVKPIVMALVGGVGTVIGPFAGAVALAGAEELVTKGALDLNGVFLGLSIVLLILFMPRGVMGFLAPERRLRKAAE
jgi:branched-chain amino acid transport system permease protein